MADPARLTAVELRSIRMAVEAKVETEGDLDELFDHIALVARYLAQARELVDDAVQLGATLSWATRAEAWLAATAQETNDG